jgi:hypothetical protein
MRSYLPHQRLWGVVVILSYPCRGRDAPGQETPGTVMLNGSTTQRTLRRATSEASRVGSFQAAGRPWASRRSVKPAALAPAVVDATTTAGAVQVRISAMQRETLRWRLAVTHKPGRLAQGDSPAISENVYCLAGWGAGSRFCAPAKDSQRNSFRCVIPAEAGIQAGSLDTRLRGVTVAGSRPFMDS